MITSSRLRIHSMPSSTSIDLPQILASPLPYHITTPRSTTTTTQAPEGEMTTKREKVKREGQQSPLSVSRLFLSTEWTQASKLCVWLTLDFSGLFLLTHLVHLVVVVCGLLLATRTTTGRKQPRQLNLPSMWNYNCSSGSARSATELSASATDSHSTSEFRGEHIVPQTAPNQQPRRRLVLQRPQVHLNIPCHYYLDKLPLVILQLL